MALKSRSLDRVCKEHNPCPFFMVEEPPPFEYYYKKEPAWLPLRRCTPNGRIRRQTQKIIVRSSDVDLDLVIPAGEDPEDRRQMMEAFLHQLNDVRIHVLSPPPHSFSENAREAGYLGRCPGFISQRFAQEAYRTSGD